MYWTGCRAQPTKRALGHLDHGEMIDQIQRSSWADRDASRAAITSSGVNDEFPIHGRSKVDEDLTSSTPTPSFPVEENPKGIDHERHQSVNVTMRSTR